MKEVDDFSDDRQKAWCIHCSGSLAGLETDEDHVPTKSLLAKPRPHHLPVVIICRECNNGFSLDEQYAVAFLSSVLSGSSDPEAQKNASARRALAASPALRAMIDQSRTEYRTHSGEMKLVWQPDIARIERVILKNARGHAYFEFGEPMLGRPIHVWGRPLESFTADERGDFEGLHNGEDLSVWPEVGSRMMDRMATGADIINGWVVVQDGTYRYSVQQADGGLLVRSIWSEYLATEVQWLD